MQNSSNPIKAILIHGNGGTLWKDILKFLGLKPSDNWFPYVKSELEKMGITVLAPRFPDRFLARKKYWLPFLEKLGADENTILIGHSSGALAAMSYAEEHKILGSVLVATAHTDLGMETEKLSGYFDTPWQWDKIKANQKFIIQFASTNDPYISIDEAHFVRDNLNTEYFEFADRGHFSSWDNVTEIPELVEALKKYLQPK
jgi:predicted alpha/beta hydrolase family esterase